MNVDPHRVSNALATLLVLLSLVTPVAGLAQFHGTVERSPEDASPVQMSELSSEDRETARTAIQCGGRVTVYGSDYASLPTPFDERYHPDPDSTRFGRDVRHQGTTYRLYVTKPPFVPMIPRAVVVITSILFLGAGIALIRYGERAARREDRTRAWTLSVLAGALILVLFWAGNYHYYVLTPVSC